MRFSNTFNVPLPPAETWKILMDIQAIVPCVPGATLQEQLDDGAYKGTVAVKLGPMALAFVGSARFAMIDDGAHCATVKAQGSDAKGRGSAGATVQFRVQPDARGSKVSVDTDLALKGAVAQYGRATGLIQGVANQLTDQFAKTLGAQIAAAKSDARTAPGASNAAQEASKQTPPAAPIQGLALLWKALWAGLINVLRGGR